MRSEATIFVVDDEPSVLKAIARLLRSSGFNVETFRSPQEFLDGYDPNGPGCLVLDVAMPGLSGLDLQEALFARQHRAAHHFPHCPRRRSNERASDEARSSGLPPKAR